MSSAAVEETSALKKKYKGVRRRRWGKWVTEIRVPGKQERLWLGSYSTPEAAAIAHDTAFYCLRRPSSLESLNFPSMLMLPPTYNINDDDDANINNLSPKSIQKAASDAGMAMDAHMIIMQLNSSSSSSSTSTTYVDNNESKTKQNSDRCWNETDQWWDTSDQAEDDQALSISVEDYL